MMRVKISRTHIVHIKYLSLLKNIKLSCLFNSLINNKWFGTTLAIFEIRRICWGVIFH